MRIINSFFLAIISTLLCSCNSSVPYSSEIQYSYDNVSNLRINYSQLFGIDRKEYYVYFYSVQCYHCNKLKNSIISFALKNPYFLYFVEYDKSVPLSDNVEKTIGISSLEGFAILGVPTLTKIEDKILILNIAGFTEVAKIIEPNLFS